MADNCKMVVFSDKAYNAIIRETFEWDPVETGGILLGHILDNGCWIVMEVLPPGYSEGREGDNVHHEIGYFEYNQRFVNYLANSVATQYKIPLELLGLWHRHPGSMDVFSSTDDRTNKTFASMNPQGAISGLVNVDSQFRVTMYYVRHNDVGVGRPDYETVEVEVGSDLIPEEYFEMQYYSGVEDELHPYAPSHTQRRGQRQNNRGQFQIGETNTGDSGDLNITRIMQDQLRYDDEYTENDENNTCGKVVYKNRLDDFIKKIKRKKSIFVLCITLLVVVFCFSAYVVVAGISKIVPSKVEEPVVYENTSSKDETPQKMEKQFIEWQSSNPEIVVVDNEGQLQIVSEGEATITAKCEDQRLERRVEVFVEDTEVPENEIKEQ